MPVEFDLPSFAVLARKRRSTLILVFALVFLATAAVSFLLPKKYNSSMSFLIRSAPSDLTDTPDRAANGNSSQVSEAEVNSEVELLTGYDILKTAVTQNGLAKRGLLDSGTSSEPEAVDSAVRKLAKDLQVTPIRRANIIEVTYDAKSPAKAAAVLRSISSAYLEAHLRSQSTPGGYQFFESQSEYYRQALQRSEKTLADLREREGIGNIVEQRTLLTQMLMDRKAALQTSRLMVALLQNEIQQAGHILGSLKPRYATTSRDGLNQFSVDHLTSQLSDLRNRRVQLASKFLDNDPLLQEVDQEIAATQTALATAKQPTSLEADEDVNPSFQTLKQSREGKEVELKGEVAREKLLEQQVNDNQKALDHLSEITGQYDVANAAVQRAQEDYASYTKRREEARVSEQLDRNKITNVVTAQAPTESQLPAPSHTALNLLLGLVFAAGASILTVFLLEYREQRARQQVFA